MRDTKRAEIVGRLFSKTGWSARAEATTRRLSETDVMACRVTDGGAKVLEFSNVPF